MSRATQSVPGGFLFVFFGLFALIFSGLSGYAGWLVFQKEAMRGQETGYSYWMLFTGSGAGLILAFALICYGIRMARQVPPYDTRDPKEPSLKF